MKSTLVIQSHHMPLPYPWLNDCMESVKGWCDLNDFQYLFYDDELFDLVPAYIIEKTSTQKVIATDLARLLVMQQALNEGFDRVVWLDADFLIFDSLKFILPRSSYALGREVWVQLNSKNRLQCFIKVHNAFLMFEQKNNFLNFYIETATRLLTRNIGSMPPQFIGPKLLTALHNIAQMPVMESAGMLSPLLIKDIIHGKGDALELFKRKSPEIIAGANLCCSSVENGELAEHEVGALIKKLFAGISLDNHMA